MRAPAKRTTKRPRSEEVFISDRQLCDRHAPKAAPMNTSLDAPPHPLRHYCEGPTVERNRVRLEGRAE